MLTRRSFLKGSAIAVTGFGIAPHWLLRAAAPAEGRRKILVAIFQRGAADGLNMVVPFFEKRYYEVRPTIAVPEPGKANGGIDLDGRFALHPSLQPLKPFWDRGQLAIVHAAGSPDPSRSHFDAQDYMESGAPGGTAEDGWMNRALTAATGQTSPLRAVSVGPKMPRTLRGVRSAVAIGDVQQFQVRNAGAAGIIESMYAGAADTALAAQSRDTFEALRMVEAINRKPYSAAPGIQYVGDFGRGLQQIARLIKADAGVEAAFADIGGWDHHSNETPQLTTILRDYATAISAFVTDMGDRMQDIVLVTMSEFGRTVHEDGNGGTDHGHGNAMMVLGGPVRGGKVYGRWPGLEVEQLYEKRDLAITTDFRDVLSELVVGQMGQKPDQVFRNYKPGPSLGLLKA